MNQFILLLCTSTLGMMSCSPVDQQTCVSPRVIDGDTISCSNYEQKIRVVPSVDDLNTYFDTPEKFKQHAKCQTEQNLGSNASKALTRLIEDSSDVIINDSNKLDKWQRHLAEIHLIKNGRISNVAHVLTKQGYGKIYEKSEGKPDWCNGETWSE